MKIRTFAGTTRTCASPKKEQRTSPYCSEISTTTHKLNTHTHTHTNALSSINTSLEEVEVIMITIVSKEFSRSFLLQAYFCGAAKRDLQK